MYKTKACGSNSTLQPIETIEASKYKREGKKAL